MSDMANKADDFEIASIPGIRIPENPLPLDVAIKKLAAGLGHEGADSLSNFLMDYRGEQVNRPLPSPSKV